MEDQNPAERYLTPATRRWIYQISIAAAPLLAGIGIMSDGTIQNILVLIAAMLTVGTNGLANSKVK